MLGEFDMLRCESCGCRRRSEEDLSIIKVRGEDNVADGLTKHVDRSKLEKYMSGCGSNFRDGRHKCCLFLGHV